MADKLMRITVVMSFLLVMALFSSCGNSVTRITDVDNGNQITVKSGEVITLTLESNPTTGYSWQIMDIDNVILVQDGDSEFTQASNSEGLVGACGMETFRFEAIGVGEATLELGYMRPWESVQPLETFSIRVIVQ
jgi:inhibitor of cysteine peptidase